MNLDLTVSNVVAIIVILVISLSIHEAMHAYTSLKLGDTTAYDRGRVSFNPLKHIDPFATILLPLITLVLFGVPLLAAKPVPFNPDRVKFDEFGAALVAAAGPLSNVALALVGTLLFHVVHDPNILKFILTFTEINVAIFVFNLIPIPPLDGSRVLYAFAPEALQKIMRQLEPFGFFLVFGLVLLVPGFASLLTYLNTAVLHFFRVYLE